LEQLRAFRGEGWIERRNKVKELLLALRSKPQAVQDFVRLHGRLPAVPGLPDQRVEETGWYGNHCVYFDALEINDLFIYPKE